MVRDEAGRVNISSCLRLELGDQGEALRFSPMCTGKQQKDLEQGNDSCLVSRQSPLAPETDGSRERGIEEEGVPARWSFQSSRGKRTGLGSTWRGWTSQDL